MDAAPVWLIIAVVVVLSISASALTSALWPGPVGSPGATGSSGIGQPGPQGPVGPTGPAGSSATSLIRTNGNTVTVGALSTTLSNGGAGTSVTTTAGLSILTIPIPSGVTYAELKGAISFVVPPAISTPSTAVFFLASSATALPNDANVLSVSTITFPSGQSASFSQQGMMLNLSAWNPAGLPATMYLNVAQTITSNASLAVSNMYWGTNAAGTTMAANNTWGLPSLRMFTATAA